MVVVVVVVVVAVAVVFVVVVVAAVPGTADLALATKLLAASLSDKKSSWQKYRVFSFVDFLTLLAAIM